MAGFAGGGPASAPVAVAGGRSVIADEITPMDFRQADSAKLNSWFHDYLRAKGETDATMGRPIDIR